jgi:hypothetical protein
MRTLLTTLVLLLGLSCVAPRPAPSDATIDPDGQAPSAFLHEVFDRLVVDDPLPRTARVVFHHITSEKGLLGLTTEADDGHIQIEVEPALSMSQLVDVLEHEWAHAMVWDCDQTDPHDELWGVAFSRAYRAGLAVIEAHEHDGDPEQTGDNP